MTIKTKKTVKIKKTIKTKPNTNTNKSKNTNNINKINNKINNKIITILEAVKKYYARINNNIHVNAYERAIYQIRKWPRPITQGKELSHLVGIGKGMIEKIDTIIKTGTLPIIKEKHITIAPNHQQNHHTATRNTKYANSIKRDGNIERDDIKTILGFGEKVALQIKNKYGITTIPELKNMVSQNKITLTRAQQLGLLHHNDLQQKIPRNEIAKIGNVIKNILADENLFILLAGSYPSGLKQDSKDIDILIVSKDNNLYKLITKLKEEKNKLNLETISLGDTKFLGLIKLINGQDGIWRHLDIRFVNMNSFPYAWLYYSSGKIFNKLIREKLKKKGYKLNEWGLYQNNKKIILEDEKNDNSLWQSITNEKQLLEYSQNIEKKIFNLANLDYKTITERY
jgi:DNA polymerase/3'-5' exonuclease PolX